MESCKKTILKMSISQQNRNFLPYLLRLSLVYTISTCGQNFSSKPFQHLRRFLRYLFSISWILCEINRILWDLFWLNCFEIFLFIFSGSFYNMHDYCYLFIHIWLYIRIWIIWYYSSIIATFIFHVFWFWINCYWSISCERFMSSMFYLFYSYKLILLSCCHSLQN